MRTAAARSTRRPQVLTRKSVFSMTFAHLERAATRGRRDGEDPAPDRCATLACRPLFGESGAAEARTRSSGIRLCASPLALRAGVVDEIQNNLARADDVATWRTANDGEGDEAQPSVGGARAHSGWQCVFATARDFAAAGEVSADAAGAADAMPSDASLLSSGKWWRASALRHFTGAVFQRVEPALPEAAVAPSARARLGRGSIAPVGASSTDDEFGGAELHECATYDRLRRPMARAFGERPELLERSPLFAVGADMSRFVVAGDGAARMINVRRALLLVTASYCMRVYGGVPVAADCVARRDNGAALLIVGPQAPCGRSTLALHVAAAAPGRFVHAGSGVVLVAPAAPSDAASSSPLRVLPLPLNVSFGGLGVVWAALNAHAFERRDDAAAVATAKSLREWGAAQVARQHWPLADLDGAALPPLWERSLVADTVAASAAAAAPHSARHRELALRGIVSLQWDLSTLGAFEAAAAAAGALAEADAARARTEALRSDPAFRCYASQLDGDGAGEALSGALCAPQLTRGIYRHDARLLAEQLRDWSGVCALGADSSAMPATALHGAVRFDCARRHVVQLLESLGGSA
jgi:hypothetical protein